MTPLQWLSYDDMINALDANPSFWVVITPAALCDDWTDTSTTSGKRCFDGPYVYRCRSPGFPETLCAPWLGGGLGTWESGISTPAKERHEREAPLESLFFQIPGIELLDAVLETPE